MTDDVTLWTISKSGFAYPVTTGLQGLCNKLMFPNEEREMWFPTKAHAEEWLRNKRAQQMMQDAADGDYQCGSCESFFNAPNDDDQCPHCFSGNWVEGSIDGGDDQ